MSRSRALVVLAAGLVAAGPVVGAGCTDSETPPPTETPDALAAPVDAPVEIDAAVPSGGPDPFPAGAVGFYLATNCPTGWAPYTDAVGRTIVPATTSDDVGMAVGTSLVGRELRPHHHEVVAGFELPAFSFAGIAGGGNGGVARAGVVDGTVATDEASSALPYVQLMVCRKVQPANGAELPRGVVSFFAEATCPAGWSPADGIGGRVLIALPDGGVAGATFGGAPLTSGEQRSHVHNVAATVATASHGIALVSGCCAGGYGKRGDYGIATTSGPGAIDLPYLQLLACTAD